MIKNISAFLMIICVSYFLNAQNNQYSHEIFVKGKDTLQYRLLMPEHFSENEKYPVVLFLHGAGERGNDNNSQLVHGSKLFLDKINRGAFPAIVVFPQCPKNSYWANAEVDRTSRPIKLEFPLDIEPTKSLELVMHFMEERLEEPYVNKSKIYVGGLSMGGMGTFELLYRKPDMFAAAFAICGGGNPEAVEAYANKTELWVFHGAKDDVVNPQLSVNMVSAYLQAGGKPNFTLYADDNHNSWDSAFGEPELLPWLFSKSKH
jgi:predicted peptidase